LIPSVKFLFIPATSIIKNKVSNCIGFLGFEMSLIENLNEVLCGEVIARIIQTK